MARTVTAEAGETLDALCWRALGTTAPLETIYAANPGLAALGRILPTGTVVQIPDAATTATPAPVRETIQLWD